MRPSDPHEDLGHDFVGRPPDLPFVSQHFHINSAHDEESKCLTIPSKRRVDTSCLAISVFSFLRMLVPLKVLVLSQRAVFLEPLKGFGHVGIVSDFIHVIIEIVGNVDPDDLVCLLVDVDLDKRTLTKVTSLSMPFLNL